MNRALGTMAIVMVLDLVGVGAAPPFPPTTGPPELVFDSSVGDDFRTLARQTWDRFLKVFAARNGCFGDVQLHADYTLGSRGGYNPATATVTVHVPGAPARLQSALVHEWAHHVEFQCQAHRSLRAAFLAAQGLPPGTPWRPRAVTAGSPASEWGSVPSEQYAEATVELVLGTRALSTAANYTREAVLVIAAWAAGD